MKKKELYTISEFARLRNVTAETLRHYDRIGLLTPSYTDPETNYRYYSIFQYEKLGTIKELRQLGIPLSIIKDYFTDRNLKKSITILEDAYAVVQKKHRELEEMEAVIKEKLDYLNHAGRLDDEEVTRVLELPERYLVTSGNQVKDEDEMGYEWTMLEKNLHELSPILATSRIGYYYDAERGMNVEKIMKVPFVFMNGKRVGGKAVQVTVPGGQYADVYVKGYENFQRAFDLLHMYMEKNGYRPDGKYFTFFPVDMTVTEDAEEEVLELQVHICDTDS